MQSSCDREQGQYRVLHVLKTAMENPDSRYPELEDRNVTGDELQTGIGTKKPWDKQP